MDFNVALGTAIINGSAAAALGLLGLTIRWLYVGARSDFEALAERRARRRAERAARRAARGGGV